jgi:CubicO group peptidase (beta-lactamase class C family)
VTQAQTDKFAAFQSSYERELKDAGIVGSSFVFLKDNKVIFEKALRLCESRKEADGRRAHDLSLASNTKQFTGIAIMQLRDRGLLKLDDPVTKYLPSCACS